MAYPNLLDFARIPNDALVARPWDLWKRKAMKTE